MTQDWQRLADYLAHILEAIERIESYTADVAKLAFLENQLVQDAVIRNLEVIGEASNNIAKRHPAFAAEHPELFLASAYRMRNAVVHGYFKVVIEIVWKTMQDDLPTLHSLIRQGRASIKVPLPTSPEGGKG